MTDYSNKILISIIIILFSYIMIKINSNEYLKKKENFQVVASDIGTIKNLITEVYGFDLEPIRNFSSILTKLTNNNETVIIPGDLNIEGKLIVPKINLGNVTINSDSTKLNITNSTNNLTLHANSVNTFDNYLKNNNLYIYKNIEFGSYFSHAAAGGYITWYLHTKNNLITKIDGVQFKFNKIGICLVTIIFSQANENKSISGVREKHTSVTLGIINRWTNTYATNVLAINGHGGRAHGWVLPITENNRAYALFNGFTDGDMYMYPNYNVIEIVFNITNINIPYSLYTVATEIWPHIYHLNSSIKFEYLT